MVEVAPKQPSAVLKLLKVIPSPMVLFNVGGQVIFANQAAQDDPRQAAKYLDGANSVKQLVREVALGRLQLPARVKLPLPGHPSGAIVGGQFVAGPAGVDVALLIDAPATAATPGGAGAGADSALSLQQVMTMLSSQLMPPVTDLITQLDKAARQPTVPPTEDLKQSAHELRNRLERLVDLVNVFGDDVLLGDERILPAELVRDICEQLRPLTERQRVTVVFRGDNADTPPVYGSARLLRRALWECVENAVLHSRQEVDMSQPLAVEIGFRAAAAHLLISVRNLGAMSVVSLGRRPFEASAADPATPAGASDVAGTSGLRIGLPLAQRIVQLHGGHVRINQSDDEGLEVLLELPTGAPIQPTQQLDIAQAQAYAADLARLMAMNRKRKTA